VLICVLGGVIMDDSSVSHALLYDTVIVIATFVVPLFLGWKVAFPGLFAAYHVTQKLVKVSFDELVASIVLFNVICAIHVASRDTRVSLLTWCCLQVFFTVTFALCMILILLLLYEIAGMYISLVIPYIKSCHLRCLYFCLNSLPAFAGILDAKARWLVWKVVFTAISAALVRNRFEMITAVLHHGFVHFNIEVIEHFS
jgi:hypothetical protein